MVLNQRCYNFSFPWFFFRMPIFPNPKIKFQLHTSVLLCIPFIRSSFCSRDLCSSPAIFSCSASFSTQQEQTKNVIHSRKAHLKGEVLSWWNTKFSKRLKEKLNFKITPSAVEYLNEDRTGFQLSWGLHDQVETKQFSFSRTDDAILATLNDEICFYQEPSRMEPENFGNTNTPHSF